MSTTTVRISDAAAEKAKRLATEVGDRVPNRAVHELGVDLVANLPLEQRKSLIKDYAVAASPAPTAG